MLAIRDRDRLVANPGGDTLLAPGQLLIVLGSKLQLSDFLKQLGEAVDGIETMTS